MYVFLGPLIKPLREEWVRDVVTHDLDGHLHPGQGSELGVHPCGAAARAELDKEKKGVTGSQVWRHLPVISEPQVLMQDQEFVASLGHILRP